MGTACYIKGAPALLTGRDKYRLQVSIGTLKLGYADLWFVDRGKDLRQVMADYVGAMAGSVTFRCTHIREISELRLLGCTPVHLPAPDAIHREVRCRLRVVYAHREVECISISDIAVRLTRDPKEPVALTIAVRLVRSRLYDAVLSDLRMEKVDGLDVLVANAGVGRFAPVQDLTVEQQADSVRAVKRFESGMVVNPITIAPGATLGDVLERLVGLNPRLHTVCRTTGRVEATCPQCTLVVGYDQGRPEKPWVQFGSSVRANTALSDPRPPPNTFTPPMRRPTIGSFACPKFDGGP